MKKMIKTVLHNAEQIWRQDTQRKGQRRPIGRAHQRADSKNMIHFTSVQGDCRIEWHLLLDKLLYLVWHFSSFFDYAFKWCFSFVSLRSGYITQNLYASLWIHCKPRAIEIISFSKIATKHALLVNKSCDCEHYFLRVWGCEGADIRSSQCRGGETTCIVKSFLIKLLNVIKIYGDSCDSFLRISPLSFDLSLGFLEIKL